MPFLKIFFTVIGGLLILDAVLLATVGKWHLGTILPALIGSVLLWHGRYWQTIIHYLSRHHWLKKLWQMAWGLAGIWLISVLVFFYYIAHNTHTDTNHQPIKAMLVLGSGYKNGQPTPILAGRLDAAAKLATTNPNAWIVLTGGIGLTEPVSEASVMANYLGKQGVAKNKMVLEEQSTSTELNIKNSIPILAKVGVTKNDPIAIVTSDFHTLRAKAIAKKQGFSDVTTVGSPTPLLTRYNNWLREYFAVVSGFILQEF